MRFIIIVSAITFFSCGFCLIHLLGGSKAIKDERTGKLSQEEELPANVLTLMEAAQGFSDQDTSMSKKYLLTESDISFFMGCEDLEHQFKHNPSNEELLQELNNKNQRRISRNLKQALDLGLAFRKLEYVSSENRELHNAAEIRTDVIFKHDHIHYKISAIFVLSKEKCYLVKMENIIPLSQFKFECSNDALQHEDWSLQTQTEHTELYQGPNETVKEFQDKCREKLLSENINSSYFIAGQNNEGQPYPGYTLKHPMDFTIWQPNCEIHVGRNAMIIEGKFNLKIQDSKNDIIFESMEIKKYGSGVGTSIHFDNFDVSSYSLEDEITISLSLNGRNILNKTDRIQEFLFASGRNWKFDGKYAEPGNDRLYHFNELEPRREVYHFKLKY